MHFETTNPQFLVPRLPQRLVRRYAIQSMHVVQTATDQSAYETAYCAAHGATDCCGTPYLRLRR
jgi:hypothetical protein